MRTFGINEQEEEIVVKAQAVVKNPPAGYVALYPKSDGKWYKKDSEGTETLIEGVTGGGGSAAYDSDQNILAAQIFS